jgi:predicted 3-demethylubiquinone-9 3-methyltransferase (glyoxalase superfamily)
MQKITTFLWFDTEAEEAATYYTSIFDNSRITHVQRTSESGPVMTVNFELAGQQFIALNGGPEHANFTEAISLYVDCADQAEVDALWAKFTGDGGQPGPCGWLKDRYGLSWQIIPRQLPELVGGPDPVRAQRALQAMLQMSKIDVKALVDAYES